MSEQLAAIKARRDAITPAPWYAERVEFKDTHAYAIENESRRIVTLYPPNKNRDADAAFIAAATDDVDTLLAMVEQRDARIDALMAMWQANTDALAAQLAPTATPCASSCSRRSGSWRTSASKLKWITPNAGYSTNA